MTTSSWDRSRRIAAVASALAVIGVTAAVLILALGVSVPETWWPSTGQAFAADSPQRGHDDPCDLIVGPAKTYCDPGTDATTAAAGQPQLDGTAAWKLLPPAAGLVALAIWWSRDAATQGRR
jgi:hypothetical protein